MRYEVHVVQAFTDEKIPTLGNPAGVVKSMAMPSEADMQKIAVKAGEPMTAFVVPRDEGGRDYDIRYYDLGGRECHICGHATVATTAQLLRENSSLDGHSLTFHLNPKYFDGQDKVLTTHIKEKEIAIDLFPSILRPETSPEFLQRAAQALGIQPDDIHGAAFSTNVRDFVVAIKDHKVLTSMKPDFAILKDMAETGPFQHEGFMVSSPAPEDSAYDLYVRVFLPITGVNEDIACGSGNCSIIPYWHDQGMNVGSKTYNAVFPYPEGREGYVGGIQRVMFAPDENRITIAAQALYSHSRMLDLSKDRGIAPPLKFVAG